MAEILSSNTTYTLREDKKPTAQDGEKQDLGRQTIHEKPNDGFPQPSMKSAPLVYWGVSVAPRIDGSENGIHMTSDERLLRAFMVSRRSDVATYDSGFTEQSRITACTF